MLQLPRKMTTTILKRRAKNEVTETVSKLEPNLQYHQKSKCSIRNPACVLAVLGIIVFVAFSFPTFSEVYLPASEWSKMPREQAGTRKPEPKEEWQEQTVVPTVNDNSQLQVQPRTKEPKREAAAINIPQPDMTPSSARGGWRLADDITLQEFGTDVCNIDRRFAKELSAQEFNDTYLFKKPVILKFHNGAIEWTDPKKWQKETFIDKFQGWAVHSGNSIDIIRVGGIGNIKTTIGQFIENLMEQNDSIGDPYYVFDSYFFIEADAVKTLRPPLYLQIKFGSDTGTFMLGRAGSGIAFHSHGDGWNGVVYGKKRWFMYPREKTPPGGIPVGYPQKEWIQKIYPSLAKNKKPLECIQEAGEIIYVPEGFYHAALNLADTLAISIHDTAATVKSHILYCKDDELAIQIQQARPEDRLPITHKRMTNIKKLLSILPDNTDILLRAGLIYHDAGLLNKSNEMMKNVIKLDPYFIMAYLHQGVVQNQDGQKELAEQMFKRVLELTPTLWEGYFTYGAFLQHQQRLEEAIDIFEKGTQINPLSRQLREVLMSAQRMMGKSEDVKRSKEKLEWLEFAGDEAGLELAMQNSNH